MTWAKGELVLAVALMAVAALYLQAMKAKRKPATFAGFTGALLVFGAGCLLFLLGVIDLGKAVRL